MATFLKNQMVMVLCWIFVGLVVPVCPVWGGQRVEPGDKVMVDITCRLDDTGELVLSTLERTATDAEVPRANVFLPLKEYGHWELFAGSGYGGPPFGRLLTLEGEIGAQISKKLPGKTVGVPFQAEIRSEVPPELADQERYMTMNAYLLEPKTQKVSLEFAREKLDRDPKPGDLFDKVDDVTVTVTRIEGEEVWLRVDIVDGGTLQTDWGKAVLEDIDEKRYRKILRPQIGDLVRTGPVIGRISDVKEQTYTVDYGHPFGGRTLVCDVVVRSVVKEEE